MDYKEKEKLVFEALGAASMCWVGGTKDLVFDSEKAKKIGDELMEKLYPPTDSPGPFGLLHLGRGSFGDAIKALKQGQSVCRSGWNGKGMFLAYSPGAEALPAENFWAPKNAEYARNNGGTAKVLPCITMKTASGEILMGWLASQTDMLADDWMIVE